MVALDPLSIATDGFMFGSPPPVPPGLLTLPLAVASMGYLKVVGIIPPVVEITSKKRFGGGGVGKTRKERLEHETRESFDLFLKVSILELNKKTGEPQDVVTKRYVGSVPNLDVDVKDVDAKATKQHVAASLKNVLTGSQRLPNITAEASANLDPNKRLKTVSSTLLANTVDTKTTKITIEVTNVVLKKPKNEL